jgi:hypothetical protein
VHQRLQGRERAAITGWEYMLLFRGGRRISAMIETTLGNTCAFSSVVLIFYGKILRV